MQNIVTALGGGSGIDTQQLVTDLVAAQRAPQQQRIDTSKEQANAQISAFGTLKSSLSELQNIVAPLANPETFNARAVNVPTTDVLTANSLTSEAQPGTYQIEVEQVAKAQSLAVNTPVDSATEALGKTGELTFTLGEWTYDGSGDPDSFTINNDKPAFSVEVEAGDSLEDIAEKINDADSAVTASVLQIDGQYQLLITAESGQQNALQITASSGNVGLSDFEFNASNHSGVVENQQGQNAKLKLNGLSVERPSNDIDDVIPGLNFTLNKADPGNSFSFSITEDKAAAEQAVRNFVEAYNTFYETAENLTGTTTDEETNETKTGELANDSTTRSLMTLLQQTISSEVTGLDSADGFSALTNVGIRTTREGRLEIVEEDFNAAFSDNFDQVANIFSASNSTSSSFIEVKQGSYGASARAGDYDVEITQSPTQGNIVGAVPNFSEPGPYEFKISVDGATSDTITLAGGYASEAEFVADLQSKINADSEIQKNTAFVDVSVDNAGQLVVTSRQYGSSSEVSFTEVNAAMETASGFNTSTTGTAGLDVKGTVNGEEAFGAGRVLLPPIDSDAYGLNITVKEGVPTGPYTFTFSQGFAGELNQVIDTYLAGNGLISNRETNLQDRITDLDADQEDLDREMTAYEERLQAQYIAMEAVIRSLNQTSGQLDGLVDRLPFTASNN